VSWDDTLLSIGTEMGTVELYSLKVLERLAEQNKKPGTKPFEYPQMASNSIVKSASAAFLKCYQTKVNGVLCCKFSWMNFLMTVGCIEKVYN
jgi:hypothetical protein